MTNLRKLSRGERIKLAAATIFGSDDSGEPERGWQRPLARAMGVDHKTIAYQVSKVFGPNFDKKFARFLRERSEQMKVDAVRLERLAKTFEYETWEDTQYPGGEQDRPQPSDCE